jgi:Holliday junction DNA helicase RuvA
MIASLNGRISDIFEDSVIIEVGGVGMLVYVPVHLISQVRKSENVKLFTQLILRQDSLTLYGFENVESREIFQLLVGVNGVGPRMGLAILSSLEVDTIKRAVINEQAEVFSRVPGVGKKTAQKILFHLQDKIPTLEGYRPLVAFSDVDAEVVGALTALGYSVVEAQAAVQSIPKDSPEDVEERLRMALQYFST